MQKHRKMRRRRINSPYARNGKTANLKIYDIQMLLPRRLYGGKHDGRYDRRNEQKREHVKLSVINQSYNAHQGQYARNHSVHLQHLCQILHDPAIRITATTARVPVYYGHSESINVEFEKPVTLAGVRDALKKAEGVVLMDDPQNTVYPTPLECADRDEVFVGRVRLDQTVPSGINMWVVADNIRKGAATNAVQIAERVIAKAQAR